MDSDSIMRATMKCTAKFAKGETAAAWRSTFHTHRNDTIIKNILALRQCTMKENAGAQVIDYI
jgi:hypothetical protein